MSIPISARTSRFWLIAALLCAVSAADVCGQPTPSPLKHRWVFCMHNMAADDQVKQLEAIMKRAAAVGYNGLLLSDYKFNKLGEMDDHYFKNVAEVRKLADTLHMELIPAIFPIGYSNGLLEHNPNLAEGLPVRDAPFRVKSGAADIEDPDVGLKNGDFESASGDTFKGWAFQDLPGKTSFADTVVKHGGSQSLRFQNIGTTNPEHALGRIMQTVVVTPYRQYHLSVWIKTEDFEAPGSVNCAVLTPAGRSLSYAAWQIKRTQNWTQYETVFNSLGDGHINIYFGSWGAKGGKIWYDDAKLETVGLLNVLQRAGCPVMVKGEDGTVYTEGTDYAAIKDDRMGVIPWPGAYETYHKPPLLRLVRGSRIHEGQKLLVSYYHPISISNDQVCACISEPEVYSLLKSQLDRVDALLQPAGFMMSHDEFRVANWCAACQARHLTPGQMLADNVKRCTDMIRARRPKADIYVWSDMFDPFHNAVDNYYLVNGSWAGSWTGLTSDVTIIDWNFEKRKEDMPFFDKQGHAQILAGYYDGDPKQIRQWLDDAKPISRVTGVMYTTWQKKYDDLEAFAKAAWGP